MLRRKLIAILIVLTALLLSLAIGAVLGIQHVFDRLDHLTSQADTTIYRVNNIQMDISTIELELSHLQSGVTRHLDTLIEAVERLRISAGELGRSSIVQETAIVTRYDVMLQQLDEFSKQAALLATTQDPQLSDAHNHLLIELATELRESNLQISQHAHQRHLQESAALTATFRWTAIGVAIGFLIAINLSVLLMLRAAILILRPVSKLTTASRALAQHRFDTRVYIQQDDEFDELARSYNDMAEQLQQTEQRQIELLQHAARTLNHELNTSISIIDLQLTLLRRSTAGDCETARRLQQIHESLRRMVGVVESLKHIRQIVLTDYVPGTKMLDLKRSTVDAAGHIPSVTTP